MKKYDIHVIFTSEAQFQKEYGAWLREEFECSDEDIQQVLFEVREEVDRRRRRAADSLIRKARIQHEYTPLIPRVYSLQAEYLTAEFKAAVDYCSQQLLGRNPSLALEHLLDQGLVTEEAAGIYTFSVFTEEYCRDVIIELKHFSESPLPKARPNSMNRNGVLVQELGFDKDCLDVLRSRYIQPVVDCLYPEMKGSVLDSHKAFTVQYDTEGDKDLGTHFDNSEVTLNICLGGQFDGSVLCFASQEPMRGAAGGTKQSAYSELRIGHRPGVAVLHRGNRLHCVEPILSGQRSNLVIWMRCSAIRNTHCPMCSRLPQLEPGEGYADGFTMAS